MSRRAATVMHRALRSGGLGLALAAVLGLIPGCGRSPEARRGAAEGGKLEAGPGGPGAPGMGAAGRGGSATGAGGAGVQTAGSSSSHQASPVSPLQTHASLNAARYKLDWSWGKAARHKGRPGWSVQNDLGYHIDLDVGYLVDWTVQLAPCRGGSSDSGRSTAPGAAGSRPSGVQGRLDRPAQGRFTRLARRLEHLYDGLPSLFGSGVARAGHSSKMDPSALKKPRVESLSMPGVVDMGIISFPVTAYCQAHYLVARANLEALDLPTDVEMMQVSLYLQGTWRPRSGGKAAPFRFQTSAANGVLGDVEDVTRLAQGAENSQKPRRLEVLVHRELDTLFNSVDFVKMDEAAVTRQVLKNLMAKTKITARLEANDD